MENSSGGGGGGGGGGGWGSAPKGNFWIGQDGNVWVAGSEGTNSAGVADSNTVNYWNSMGYSQIEDPNPQRGNTLASTTTAPSGGGGGPAPKVFNQAGANNTQRTIDEIPGLLDAALGSERTRYGNTVGEFNTQEAGQRAVYGDSTTTNQKNYDANFMDSIRAGIKGLGGLMSLLRGTGAGGGTAEDQVRDTVGGVTANDIRAGSDTREENQTTLDSSLSNFLTELQRKRRANEDVLVNNERSIRRDADTQMQDLFGKMAGFYGDVENKAQSDSWMNRAGALTPSIAANSRTQVSPYDTAPVTVKAPELTAFADPTQPSVTTAADGQVGSGIFTMNNLRRRREAPPVGA